VRHRGSVGNVVVSLLAFTVFMVLLLVAVAGFGVGIVELVLWSALFATGVLLVVRRHRTAWAASQ